MFSLVLLLILLFALIIFLFLINLKWCIQTIRDIARDECGYTKLVQISVFFLLSVIFLSIIIYYFLNPAEVDRIDVILTVVVGWLGAIIGSFFGEKGMANLEDKRRVEVAKLINIITRQDSIISKLENNLKNE